VISAVVETIQCHKQMHLFAIINSFYANWLSFNKNIGNCKVWTFRDVEEVFFIFETLSPVMTYILFQIFRNCLIILAVAAQFIAKDSTKFVSFRITKVPRCHFVYGYHSNNLIIPAILCQHHTDTFFIIVFMLVIKKFVVYG